MERSGQLIKKPAQHTQHIQKAWVGPVAANHSILILYRALCDVDKVRILAVAFPHSGDRLHAPSITAVGLRLSEEAFRVAVARRLGCKACEPVVKQWTYVVCMGYPDAEALPDNNNVIVIWMTSYGEQSSELRCQQVKNQVKNQWAWCGMTTSAQMGPLFCHEPEENPWPGMWHMHMHTQTHMQSLI